MVQIIRKGALPRPEEVAPGLRALAAAAHTIRLREPRPVGFPLLFDQHFKLFESAVAFLHEHGVERGHSADTVRTYAEILYDWFETLEQNDLDWSEAVPSDLVAYRNRMMSEPSGHTSRPYSTRTINHRVRGVLRFYEWTVRTQWLKASPLVGRESDFAISHRPRPPRMRSASSDDSRFFVLRQYEAMPCPLAAAEVRELLATLAPPYDLMARWQIYTGVRVSELLKLKIGDVAESARQQDRVFKLIDVFSKGHPNLVLDRANLAENRLSFRGEALHAIPVALRRADHDQAADEVRPGLRHQLGDTAAHGEAKEVDRLESQTIDERLGVLPHFGVGGRDNSIGAGDATVVEDDDFAILGEAVKDRGVPVVEVAGEMLKQASGIPVCFPKRRKAKRMPAASTN